MMKKIVSIIVVAALLCGVNVTSINAAGTYYKGDINGDGVIDTIDLVYMQQFLNGSIYADGETAERLDLNRDYIINEYDKALLSPIVMGINSTCYMNHYCTSALPSQENRQYKKYTISTASETTYTLNSLNNIPNRVIIGDDDRIPESGLKGVVKISNQNGFGTGFVVDDHTILTVAHNIYDRSNYSFKSSIACEIYVNNTPLAYPINITELHVPVSYISSSDYDALCKYDYAIIKVSNNLRSFINFDLGILRNDVNNFSKDIYVTGFGGGSDTTFHPININLQNVKSTGIGNLLPSTLGVWNNSIYHDVDIVSGDSGGPIYTVNPDGSKTVIGIQNLEHFTVQNNTPEDPLYNSGIRITTDILHFVYNNFN